MPQPPGPGEARIRHTAVALNFRDILVRRQDQHAAKLPSVSAPRAPA